jgi:hypothetical protein
MLKTLPVQADRSIDAQQSQTWQKCKKKPLILYDHWTVETVFLGQLLNLLGCDPGRNPCSTDK